MADLQKTIEIIFAGVDQTTGVIENIGGGISKVGQGVQQATQPFADLADTVLLTSAAITALGVAALTFAANEAVKLESAMIELNKVMGDGEGVAKDYSDTFGTISNKFGVGQDDIIELAASFKQAGFNISEALGLTEDALTAAAVGNLAYEKSGSLVIRTLNGFQAPASESGRLIDVLNNAANNFATSFGELGEGMARISPITKQLGFSFEETAGLLVPVIEVFGSGSEAANGLRTSLLKLGSDSKPVVDALESIGIDTSELVTAKDRLQALQEIYPALTDVQQTFISQEIAGIEQAAKFNIVLDNQARVLEVTKSSYSATGSAAKELEIALASTELTFKRFGNSFKNIGAAIGNEFINPLGDAVNSATSLNEAILNSLDSESIKPVFESLRGVFTSFSAEISGVADALPEAMKGVDFSPVLNALDEVTDAFGDIFGELDLTKPEDLEKAIQLIIDSIGSLGQVVTGIINEFDIVFETAFNGIGAFNDLTDSEKQAAGEALGLAKIINKLGGILDSVGGIIEGVGIALGVLLGSSLLGKLPSLISLIATAFTSLTAGAGVLSAGLVATGTGLAAATAAAAPFILAIGGIVAIFAELNNGTVSNFVDELLDLSNKQADLAETTKIFGAATGALFKKMQDGELTTAQYRAEMQKLGDAQILAKLGSDNLSEAMYENAKSVLKTDEGLKKLNELYAKSGDNAKKLGEKTTEAGEQTQTAFDKSLDPLRKMAEELKNSKNAADDLGKGTTFDEFGNVIDTATNKTTKLKTDLESLNNTTATVKVISKTQQAQNDLERFKTVVESLNSTIESTGTTLTGLAGSITGNGFGDLSVFDQSTLVKVFEQEAALRNESINLQNKLILTEVQLAEARLKSIEDGDAAITIDTQGLEPILDLLLTTIIQNAQVKATSSGSAFLVGNL